MRKKKRLPVIIAFVVIFLIGILWVTLPVAAQLSFSLQIYCASTAADENAVDYLADNGSRLVFANQESLRFLSKMALKGELRDVTGCDLAPWPTPAYYLDDWEIGGNDCLLCHHFGRLYIIVPDDGEVDRFWELIDNAIMFFQDESGQIYEIQSSIANRVEILHETGDKARDTTVAITDEKDVSELAAMYDTLQTKSTSRPLEVDRFILTFYQDDRALWRWWIAVSEDGRAIVTASSLRRGNYTVENSFDFDRFVELLNGQ